MSKLITISFILTFFSCLPPQDSTFKQSAVDASELKSLIKDKLNAEMTIEAGEEISQSQAEKVEEFLKGRDEKAGKFQSVQRVTLVGAESTPFELKRIQNNNKPMHVIRIGMAGFESLTTESFNAALNALDQLAKESDAIIPNQFSRLAIDYGINLKKTPLNLKSLTPAIEFMKVERSKMFKSKQISDLLDRLNEINPAASSQEVTLNINLEKEAELIPNSHVNQLSAGATKVYRSETTYFNVATQEAEFKKFIQDSKEMYSLIKGKGPSIQYSFGQKIKTPAQLKEIIGNVESNTDRLKKVSAMISPVFWMDEDKPKFEVNSIGGFLDISIVDKPSYLPYVGAFLAMAPGTNDSFKIAASTATGAESVTVKSGPSRDVVFTSKDSTIVRVKGVSRKVFTSDKPIDFKALQKPVVVETQHKSGKKILQELQIKK